jgi:hypothetical protein
MKPVPRKTAAAARAYVHAGIQAQIIDSAITLLAAQDLVVDSRKTATRVFYKNLRAVLPRMRVVDSRKTETHEDYRISHKDHLATRTSERPPSSSPIWTVTVTWTW